MKGMSLLEIILVVALIAILAVATAPFAANSLRQQQFASSIGVLKSYLLKAQSYSMANKDGALWGVCQNSNFIRLYSGSCNSPTFNEDFQIPPTVNISGLTDVNFNNLRGEPSQALALTVSDSSRSVSVTLNSAGMLEDD